MSGNYANDVPKVQQIYVVDISGPSSDTSSQAGSTMKDQSRKRDGEPAKIAPLEPPKEIHEVYPPRCAMQGSTPLQSTC